MASTTVSVIIPNYCHAPYLKERIESVLNQTYTDFEVILLDDCSPDHSREVIETFRGDPRITHIIYNEHNSGSPFRQWQKGFELAAGSYIWIAESDDVAEPTFLETCVRELDRHPSAVLAFTDCIYIDAASNPIGRTRYSQKIAVGNKGGTVCFSGSQFLKKRLLRKNYIANASMVLFRKSFLPDDLTYTDFRYVGDWLFWAECALKGDVIYIDRPLDRFRQHKNSTTAKSTAEAKNFVETLRFLNHILSKFPLRVDYRNYLYGKFFVPLFRRRHKYPQSMAMAYAVSPQCHHPFWCVVWYRIARPFRFYY